jgi:threonylcarbamoyladenosine tRNA methylthiotransferase MtaB
MDIADIIMNNDADKGSYVSEVSDIEKFNVSYSIADRVRSFIKVQDGCDYNCSFCTIPMARGKSRSAKIEEVTSIIESLKTKGFNEIVLSGINLGDFGKGTGESCYDLLNKLDGMLDIPRIRISSIEPNLLTDRIVTLLSKSDKFMPHLHIPLQSGSNKILKLMKRRYTKEFYEDKINLIKRKIPNISIGVDVITGFPTETEEDFLETYNLLNRLEVSYLHVFTYSERENTLGASLESKVPQKIRNERSKRLRALSDVLKSKFIINNMDKSHKVLIESKDDEIVHGYTENYIKVKIMNKNLNINQLVSVKPIDQYLDHMVGAIE